MGIGIVVAGKGGVGKTSVAAALALLLSRRGHRVIAVDTDSVPNLAYSLGLSPDVAGSLRPLLSNADLIEERTGARPGEGWGLFFTLNPRVDDIIDKYGVSVNDRLTLLVVGSIEHGGGGCLCPAIAFARSLVAWLLERPWIVVIDAEAGAEVFGRGLGEKLDFVIIVAEPNVVSIHVANKLARLAEELAIDDIIFVLNKVRGESDEHYMEKLMPGHRVFTVPYDPLLEKLSSAGRGVAALPETSPFLSHVLIVANYILSRVRHRGATS